VGEGVELEAPGGRLGVDSREMGGGSPGRSGDVRRQASARTASVGQATGGGGSGQRRAGRRGSGRSGDC
jgi:hypothetical protein